MNKYFLKIHRLIGAFLALNLFLIGITGIVLIWKDEIHNLSNPKLNKVLGKSEFGKKRTNVIKKINSNIEQNFTNKKILSIFKDDEYGYQARITEIGKTKFRGATKLFFDESGELMKKKETKSKTFLDTVLKLHRELLLGTYGKYLVGLIGIFSVGLIFSGLLLSKKYRNINLSKLPRIQLRNIHLNLAEKLSIWILLIILTGTLLSFNSLIINTSILNEVRSFTPDGFNISTSRKLGLNDFLKEFEKKQHHNLDLDFISFPGNEFSLPNSFVSLIEGGREKKLLFFSTLTGQYQEKELSLILQLLIWSEPLHFGNYGGVLLKIFWSIMTLIYLYVIYSGVKLLYLRKYGNNCFKRSFINELFLKRYSGLSLSIGILTILIFLIESQSFKFMLVSLLIFLLVLIIPMKKIRFSLRNVDESR